MNTELKLNIFNSYYLKLNVLIKSIMNDIIEISELDLNNNNDFKQTKTTNFGGGLEFLMNDKIKDITYK